MILQWTHKDANRDYYKIAAELIKESIKVAQVIDEVEYSECKWYCQLLDNNSVEPVVIWSEYVTVEYDEHMSIRLSDILRAFLAHQNSLAIGFAQWGKQEKIPVTQTT